MTAPNRNGEVRIEGDTATLLFTRELAHPPESVWEALTDPKALKGWFSTAAQIDPRVGGRVDMISGQAGFHWTGAILAWDPPHLYEYEWNADPRAELPQGERSIVRWELAAVKGGTRLTLTHRRLTKGTAIGFAPGTHAFLDRLESHLAGEPQPDWWTRYQEVAGAYPKWQRT